MMSVTEAAELLGISRALAYELARSQRLLSATLDGDERGSQRHQAW
jgi:excisionase family DNA binding protein